MTILAQVFIDSQSIHLEERNKSYEKFASVEHRNDTT